MEKQGEFLKVEGPLPLPDCENIEQSQGASEKLDFSGSTGNQADSQGVVPLGVQRRRWYESLQFPENQHDFDPSRRGKDHSLYLVSCGPFVKIGVAWDPARRFGDFVNGAPWDMKMEAAYWLPRSVSAIAEAYCHAALEQFWRQGEWFEVDVDVARRAVYAICLRAVRSRGRFVKRVMFEYEPAPDRPPRPGSARLLGPIKGYQPPPPFPEKNRTAP